MTMAISIFKNRIVFIGYKEKDIYRKIRKRYIEKYKEKDSYSKRLKKKHFASHQMPYMPALDNWHKAFSKVVYYRNNQFFGG
jgi:hypothetical protein